MTEGVRGRVEREVARAMEAHALWPAGATVVAAVSGGADSLCLLGVLLALRERGHPCAPGEIIVAHLDHGLRGAAGEADARYVAELAARLGLRCVTDRVDVAALARSERRSLEDAARRARYAFLRRVAGQVGASRICTGHTQDDQAETVLLHLLRGGGLAGLAGMAPLAGDIARPLLGVSREQTEAYCAAPERPGWQAREDASNADTRFARNRVRHELLPVLEGFNPNVRETLARNAALIAADERYLEQQTDAAWPGVARVSRHVSTDAVELDLAALRAQPLALRRRIIRRAVQRLSQAEDGTHGERGMEARHVALIDGLIERGTTGDALDLPGGLRGRRGYDALIFERPPLDARPDHPAAKDGGVRTEGLEEASALRLPVPGMVELPEVGWRVRAWLSRKAPGLEAGYGPSGESGEPAAHSALLPALEGVGNNADVGRAEQRAYLDADAAGDALYVRTWRPGDRFRPLGMAREKKLQDFFADAKVPRALRHRLPLVWNDRHVLWVAGQRIDDRVRLTPATRRVLVLELEPLAGGGHADGQWPRL